MNKRIKYLSILFLSVIIFLPSCLSDGNERQISLDTIPPFVIEKNGAELFQYWELKNNPFLWDTNFVEPPNLKLYKDSLNNVLG